MNTKSNEWRFIPQGFMFTERAFQELCVERKCFEYQIARFGEKFCLERVDHTIKMNFDDVTVYGKLLELTSVRNFASQTNGLIIGELCGFPIRNREEGSDCQRASKSIKKLQKAGYLQYFKRSEIMIPIVRMLERKSYDQEGGNPISISDGKDLTKSGFDEFVDKKKQESLFRRQEKRKARNKTNAVELLYGT